MLYEAEKHLSSHYWRQLQHSARGGVIKAKVWMGNHHYLYDTIKLPEALVRYLTEVIFSGVRYQIYMLKTPL